MFDRFLDNFRKHEADDQLDIFPPERKKSPPWFLIIGIMVVVIGSMWLSVATAEEEVPLAPRIITTGLLCDTIEQLHAAVDSLSSADATESQPKNVEGCGYVGRPTLVFWRPIGVYENDHVVVLMAEFHIRGLPTQYSYVEHRAKPELTSI